MVLLLACFVFAGLFGCISIANSSGGSEASLSLYLNRYMTLLSEGASNSPSFLSTFCDFFLLPILVFLLGLTSLGVFMIPLVISARVFLLSYAISAFFKVFGTSGFCTALSVFGLEAFVSLPVLIAIGVYALLSAGKLAQGAFVGRTCRLHLAEYFSLLPSCGAILLPAVFLQWAVMPQLLYEASKLLFLD